MRPSSAASNTQGVRESQQPAAQSGKEYLHRAIAKLGTCRDWATHWPQRQALDSPLDLAKKKRDGDAIEWPQTKASDFSLGFAKKKGRDRLTYPVQRLALQYSPTSKETTIVIQEGGRPTYATSLKCSKGRHTYRFDE